jgi:hypothetical protein
VHSTSITGASPGRATAPSECRARQRGGRLRLDLHPAQGQGEGLWRRHQWPRGGLHHPGPGRVLRRDDARRGLALGVRDDAGAHHLRRRHRCQRAGLPGLPPRLRAARDPQADRAGAAFDRHRQAAGAGRRVHPHLQAPVRAGPGRRRPHGGERSPHAAGHRRPRGFVARDGQPHLQAADHRRLRVQRGQAHRAAEEAAGALVTQVCRGRRWRAADGLSTPGRRLATLRAHVAGCRSRHVEPMGPACK